MTDVRDLISRWPKPQVKTLADDCAVNWMTVHQWRRRHHIPPEYWTTVVASARRHKVKGVTFELLAEMTASARPPKNVKNVEEAA